jgi:hypothetical protein
MTMGAGLTLNYDSRRRIAIPASFGWVGVMLPHGTIGVYVLLRDAAPIYVGRSDHCLRSRLLEHAPLPFAAHVIWEPCGTDLWAFELEAFWFHQLRSRPDVLNLAHPGRPNGYVAICPYCGAEKGLDESFKVTGAGRAGPVGP